MSPVTNDDTGFSGPATSLAPYEQIANLPFVNLKDAPYNVDPTGVVDATTAINAAIAAYKAQNLGVRLVLPPGTIKITGGVASEIVVNQNAMTIEGCAVGPSTIINFVPSIAGKAAFHFTGNYQGVRNLYFSSTDTTTAKTMVSVDNCSFFSADGIFAANAAWLGAGGSIGVSIVGASPQNIYLRNLYLYADTPLSISATSLDHFSCRDYLFVAQAAGTNHAVNVGVSTSLSNVIFDGDGAFVRCLDGFHHVPTSGSSIDIHLSGIRYEQATGAGFFVNADYSGVVNTTSVTVYRCYASSAGAGAGGIKGRKISGLKVNDFTFIGVANVFDIDGTVEASNTTTARSVRIRRFR